ncbi:MAG: hypothetical protein U0P81_11390 [Holophagaceae bacterium]
MDLTLMLQSRRERILDEAVRSVDRARLEHYERAGEAVVRQRLGDLLGLVMDALRDRDLGPILAHAEAVARQRFEAGVDLAEVQTAFNVLEEILWRRILQELPAEAQGEALGLVGTALGAGKDRLARTYVSLATRTHAPSLDLQALFAGGTGG